MHMARVILSQRWNHSPFSPRSSDWYFVGEYSKDDRSKGILCVRCGLYWHFSLWPYRPPYLARPSRPSRSVRLLCPSTSSHSVLGMAIYGPPATGHMTRACPATTGSMGNGLLRQKKASCGRRAIGHWKAASIASAKAIGVPKSASKEVSTTASDTRARAMLEDAGT